jgi:hypothetical protein
LNVQTDIVVGSFRINNLNNIVVLDDAPPIHNAPSNVEGGYLDSETFPSADAVHQRVAVLIERNPKVGDVALVYNMDVDGNVLAGPNGTCDPEVWFHDNRALQRQLGGGQGGSGGGGGPPCAWHYIARSFSCYYRLLLVHLGILGWQFAFTPRGLAPLTVQWMRLYCPERLSLDAANLPQSQGLN